MYKLAATGKLLDNIMVVCQIRTGKLERRRQGQPALSCIKRQGVTQRWPRGAYQQQQDGIEFRLQVADAALGGWRVGGGEGRGVQGGGRSGRMRQEGAWL